MPEQRLEGVEDRIKCFLRKYRNKTVKFDDLTPYYKGSYVLTDLFNYHINIVGKKAAIKRTYDGFKKHKKDGFALWQGKGKKMKIADGLAKAKSDYQEYKFWYNIRHNGYACLGTYTCWAFSKEEAIENCKRDVKAETNREPRNITDKKPDKHPDGGIIWCGKHYKDYDPKTGIIFQYVPKGQLRL